MLRKIGIDPKRVQHIYHEPDAEDHNTNNYVGIICYLTKDDVNVILTVSWKLWTLRLAMKSQFSFPIFDRTWFFFNMLAASLLLPCVCPTRVQARCQVACRCIVCVWVGGQWVSVWASLCVCESVFECVCGWVWVSGCECVWLGVREWVVSWEWVVTYVNSLHA